MWKVLRLNADLVWEVLKDGFATEQEAHIYRNIQKRIIWDPMKVVKDEVKEELPN